MEFVKIAPEQKRQFDEEGYLVLREAIDSETVSALKEAGDRLIDSDRQLNRQRRPGGKYDGFRNCVSMDDAFLPLDHQSQGFLDRRAVAKSLSVAFDQPFDLSRARSARVARYRAFAPAGTATTICRCATWAINIFRAIH